MPRHPGSVRVHGSNVGEAAGGDSAKVPDTCAVGCPLTIVGGVRDALLVWRRGRLWTVCARVACRAWSAGPSTSPLGIVNAINVIAPYRYLGMWVFDDARVGLVQEPFVSGADAIIDRAVAHIPGAQSGFLMLFSSSPFPGHTFRLEWRRAEMDGNWYYSADLDMKGWLCPALLKYFDEPPRQLFMQVKPKPHDA